MGDLHTWPLVVRVVRPVTTARRVAAAVAFLGLLVVATIAATYSPALVFGGMAAVVLVIATTLRPMVGIVAWLAVLVLVPDWTPLPVGLKPIGAIGVIVLVGLLLSRRRARLRIAWADFALVAAVVALAVLTFLDGYPIVLLSNLAAISLASYLVGRTAPMAARRAYVYAMIAVSIWGVLETLTQVHVFSQWMLSPSHHWELIQTRSGVDRSEAAFGHAIAYGASIAMAIPFARELPKRAGLVQVILLAGVLVSFSRGPLLTAAFTLGLAVSFAARGRRRLGSILGFSVVLAAILIVFQFLYSGADAADTEQSGDQRTIQLLATLPHVQWFGSMGLSFEDGRVQTLGTDIIDNTFLRLAINFGWVLAAMILAPLIFSIVRFIRGERSPASLALIGQIPVLAVTSLITQWQAALFFVAGMAITELVALRASRREARIATDDQAEAMNRAATPAATTARAFSTDGPRPK